MEDQVLGWVATKKDNPSKGFKPFEGFVILNNYHFVIESLVLYHKNSYLHLSEKKYYMINTVLFDMDGVICHTNPFHSKAFHTFFKKRNMHPTEEEFGKHMYGKSNSYIFSHFFGRKIEGEELLAYEAEKEGLFREIYADYVSPIEGLLSFLDGLVDQNFKLGVATSAPGANMDLILDKLNIRSYFGSLMASEDVTIHKPDPQVYLRSAKNLKANPDECLVFEDSYSGVSAAINAKMKVVGVLSSHTKDELPPCDGYIKGYNQNLLNQLF